MQADFIRANVVTAALLAASLGIVYSAFEPPTESDPQFNFPVLHQYPQDRDTDRDGPLDCGNAGPNDTPNECDDDDPNVDGDTPIQT